MIPISLSISGFLSYRDPVEIDFTGFDLACIAGANGAGKSSILDAITWVLFGQGRKRDESVINIQSGTAEVTLVFAYEHNLYRVNRANPRGKTGILEFHIAQDYDATSPAGVGPEGYDWKPLTAHTTRETQGLIEETLRLDYETFVNAAFFLQGKADQFTQQRPSDRKRILSSILGLEAWEDYRQRTARRRKAIENEITVLDGRLSEINAELSEEAERKARLERLEAELDRLTQTRLTQAQTLENIRQMAALLAEQRKMAGTMERQIASTEGRLADLARRRDSRQEEADSYAEILAREAEINAAFQRLQAARTELKRLDEVGAQFHAYEKRRQEPQTAIEAERARLAQELETLEAQGAALQEQQADVAGQQARLETLEGEIAHFEKQLAHRKALEADLVGAQEALANAKAENPRLKAEMDDLKARIDQLTETDGAACPICGQPLSPAERENLIQELNALGTSMGDKWRANRALLAESGSQVASLQAEIGGLQSLDDQLLATRGELNQLESQAAQAAVQAQAWESGDAPRLGEIRESLEGNSYAPEARAALAEIDRELMEIGYDAAAHDRVRAEAEAPAVEADHRALDRAKAALAPLEDELANLNKSISDLEQNEIPALQAEYDRVVAQLAAAQAETPDLGQAQMELMNIQEQENQMRVEVGAAGQKVTVLDSLKTRRTGMESDREALAAQVGQHKQLERAFGKDGVPALLIEQALPQIETKANDILERLSDGTMSVRFKTQRELKTRDTLKETLDIEISDSVGPRDYELFSGGEAFRVNFAIRLALSEVLAQRAGARLQTLVIDEGFGSQDALGRQRLVEAINTVKADFAKILVITHIDSLKDAFPTRIEVEKTPRGSVVQVI